MVLVPLINHIGHQVQVQSLKDVDDLQQQVIMPPWLGNDDFHRSHQSNLIRKDTDFYQHKFPNVNGDLPYIWPSSLIQL